MGGVSYIAKPRLAFLVLAVAAGTLASHSLLAAHGNTRTRSTAETLSRIDMDFGTMTQPGQMGLDACSGTLASRASLTAPGMCRAVFLTAGHCVMDTAGQLFSEEIRFRYPGERREASFVIPRGQVRVETPYVPPQKGEKKSGKNDFAIVYIDLACNLIARLQPARLGPLNADGTVAIRPGETVSTQKRFSQVVDNRGVVKNPGGGTRFAAAVHNADTPGVLTTEFFSPDQVGKIDGGDSGSGVLNADGELIGVVAVSTTGITTVTKGSDGRVTRVVANNDPSLVERDFSFDGSALGALVKSLQQSKMPFDQNGAISSTGGQQLASLSESTANPTQHGGSGANRQTFGSAGSPRQLASTQPPSTSSISSTSSASPSATAAPLIPGLAFDPASNNDSPSAQPIARPVATKPRISGPGKEIPTLTYVRQSDDSTDSVAYVTNTEGGWSNVRILDDGTLELTDGKQISAESKRELLLAYEQSYGSGAYGDKSLLVSKAVDKYKPEIDKWKSEIEDSRLAQQELANASQVSNGQQVSPYGPSLASAGLGEVQGTPVSVTAGGNTLPAGGARAGHAFSGKPEITPQLPSIPQNADTRDTAPVKAGVSIANVRMPNVPGISPADWNVLKAGHEKLHAKPAQRPVHATAQADGKATPLALAGIKKCMACHTPGSGRLLILSGTEEQALSGLREALEKRNLGVSAFKVYEMMKSNVFGNLTAEEQNGLMAYVLRTDESKSEEQLNLLAIEKFVGVSTEIPPKDLPPNIEQFFRSKLPKTNNPILNAIFSDPSTEFRTHQGPGAVPRKYQDGGDQKVTGLHSSESSILDGWEFGDGTKMFNQGILRGVLGQGFGLTPNTQNFKFVWRPKVNGKTLPDAYSLLSYKDSNSTDAPGVIIDNELPIGSIVGEVVLENGVAKHLRFREVVPGLRTINTAYGAFPTAEHLASAIEANAPEGTAAIVAHLRNPKTLTPAKPLISDYHTPIINERGYKDVVPPMSRETEQKLASKAVFSSTLGQAWKKDGDKVAYGPTGTNSSLLPAFDVHSVAVSTESCNRCHDKTLTNFAFLHPGVRNKTTQGFNLQSYGMTYGNRQGIFSYDPFPDRVPTFGKSGKFAGSFSTDFGQEPQYDNRFNPDGSPRFRHPESVIRKDQMPAAYADFYK